MDRAMPTTSASASGGSHLCWLTPTRRCRWSRRQGLGSAARPATLARGHVPPAFPYWAAQYVPRDRAALVPSSHTRRLEGSAISSSSSSP